MPINCHKCGKFVGPDGNKDIIYDGYMGGYEQGWPICGQCLKKEQEEKQEED